MLIVAEGMDNSGKTTLVATLAKALHATYIKAERPLNPSGYAMGAYRNMLQHAQRYAPHVICDRSPFISEPIYGTIIRGNHGVSALDIAEGLKQIDLVIYCRPDDETILGTIGHRPQMEGVVSHAPSLLYAYDKYFQDEFIRSKMLYYDFKEHSVPAIINIIKDMGTP